MVATLEQAYMALDENFQSTSEINRRLRQSWATTYGQLSRLVANGRAECVEIKAGRKNNVAWRKKIINE